MPETIKGDDAEIGSPNWFKFLEMPTTKSFRYEGIAGSFTARKRNDGAWNAYRKLFGKLRQEYLGLSKVLNHERLEAIAAKLAQSDLEYWKNKAKIKRGVIQNKSITVSSKATSYTDKRITELETQLEEANQKAADQDEKIESAIALLKGALPLPANKGGAIKDVIRRVLSLLS
jgi:hypothetical protein